jgi:hypothetical protein
VNLFEFLLVIVSIVLGLGITELLNGVVRVFRGDFVSGRLHVLWMLFVFQVQVQMAWGLWALRVRETWLYPEFLLMLLGPILLYMAAAVLFPSVRSSDEGLDDYLIRRRRPFFLLMAAYVVFSALYSGFLLNSDLKLIPVVFRVTAFALFIVLAIIGNRRAHLFLGLAIFVSQLLFTYLFTFMVTAVPIRG